MMLSVSLRKALLLVLVALLGTFFLAACGSDTSASGTSTTSATLSPEDATAQASKNLMTFIGTPTAKMVSGSTFEVDGKIKNGDTKQHDIFVKVELVDASGKVIASATKNVDNVAGGATQNFAIQGTTPQPSWSKLQVTVTKVTENVNGTGGD